MRRWGYNMPKAFVNVINLFKLKAGYFSQFRRARVNMASSSKQVTAGIVIIGDEIIKGQVQDTNSFYLCQQLHGLGVVVKAIIVIPDELRTISKWVKDFSDSYTYVVTAGGIGPTHDDVTFEAVATAFEQRTALNENLENLYKSYFKERYTDAHKKLSMVPQTAQLVYNPSGFPVVQVQNVFILPGVPKFLKFGFSALEQIMKNPSYAMVTRFLYLTIDEMSIAQKITELNEIFHAKIHIGSYPEWHNNYFKLKISLESSDQETLDRCEAKFRELVSPKYFISYNPDPLRNPMLGVSKLIAQGTSFSAKLQKTVEICKQALDKYDVSEICLCFNGGKDCTLLLHLWYAVVTERPGLKSSSLNSMYIRSKTPFPESESFIEDCIVRYGLNMLRYDGNIKEQLEVMKVEHPKIKAVIMGTRSSDPHGQALEPFTPTDNGWPEYMRINPLLDWTYSDIWYFIRELSLPYCSLYDVGYTSLGSLENTHPNPALRYTDSKHVVHYKPAYTLTLTDDAEERAGRTRFVPDKPV